MSKQIDDNIKSGNIPLSTNQFKTSQNQDKSNLINKALPEDEVKLSNDQNALQLEITYSPTSSQFVNNIINKFDKVVVNYEKAKELRSSILSDIQKTTISMQAMQNKLVTCAFQRQLGQISETQAKATIYSKSY